MKKTVLLALAALLLSISSCNQGNNKAERESNKAPAPVESRRIIPSVDIHKAALEGDLGQVTAALDGGMSPDSLDQTGRTALMYASFNGNIAIMKTLISKGASVNLADMNGTSALMMAASGPFPDAVRLLLDSNADIDATDKKEHFSALMYAASEGQMAVVRLLIERKANTKLKDVDGDDAYTFAVNNGHKEIAALLKTYR